MELASMSSRLPHKVSLLLAIQFLTRISVGKSLDSLTLEEVRSGLATSVVWFPVVGGGVGVATALLYWIAHYFWVPLVALVIALIGEALLTGAFHEDAVADFCDGFGGGDTSSRIVEIMKDSRIGTYGALGLLFAVLLRIALLLSLEPYLVVLSLIGASTFGRYMAVVAMTLIPPLEQGSGVAKDIGSRVKGSQLRNATSMALPFLLPLACVKPWSLLVGIGVSLLFILKFRRMILHRLGGVTGDCLGFAVYATQVIIILAVGASWRLS
jgi:adenosylcobinamide-GDP ribazoletransferase